MKHLRMFAVSLVLGLYITGLTVLASEEIHLEMQHLNMRLTGYTTASYFDIVFPDCARKCLLTSRCRSFNYNIELLACELKPANSSSVSTSKFSRETGWVFSDASPWPKEIAGTCADMPCGTDQKCLPTSPTFTCMYVQYSSQDDGQNREVPGQNLCKSQSDCTSGRLCTDNQCVCPFRSVSEDRCLARFGFNGGRFHTGILLISLSGTMYTVESRNWNWKKTAAVCQLIKPEYKFGGSYYLTPYPDKNKVLVVCPPGASILADCQYITGSHGSQHVIGVTCYTSDVQDLMRLSPPYVTGFRRLEVQYNGVWGSVCETRGDGQARTTYSRVLKIVCASLNSKPAAVCGDSCGGGPEVPVIAKDLNCNGAEPHVLFCQIPAWNPKDEKCHGEEIGLMCS